MSATTQKPKITPKPTITRPPITNTQILEAATGRWAEVANEVKAPEPYVIDRPDGTRIVISPPTRRRRKAMKAAQSAFLLTGAQLAEAQRANANDQATLSRIQGILDAAEKKYDDELFGDAADEVYEFFDDLDEVFWDAMYQDIHDRLVNRVEPPADMCSKCGQKIAAGDGEEADESAQGPGKDD